MSIRNYRLFLVRFTMASLVFLTGFEKGGINDALAQAEKQVISDEVQQEQPKSQESAVQSKRKKIKNKRNGVSASGVKTNAAEETELQKPLDLSMPFKDSESAILTIEQNKAAQKESLNIFATENKKMRRSLDLAGQMLMSQEPEEDRRKSLDGAGIVINLKR
jgi:hypothetical protein